MTKSKEAVDEVRTSDLYFAAYLQTAGVALKRTEPAAEGNGKIFFVFDASISNVEELKAGWFNNQGKVPANLYAHAIKSLKTLCHVR